jgi:hypothetical protein
MRGLPKLSSGRNLTVKPFALAARSSGQLLAEDDRGNEFDGGVHVKYGITPRLTMDLTYRTDFSQVEVDREQVNLTRFPLFFPERREFFLENSGTFTFGAVNSGPGSPRTGTSLRDFTLFHSREIGLEGGRPVPLFGGARLTGRVGGWEVGVLDVQSEAVPSDPAENFGVGERSLMELAGWMDSLESSCRIQTPAERETAPNAPVIGEHSTPLRRGEAGWDRLPRTHARQFVGGSNTASMT